MKQLASKLKEFCKQSVDQLEPLEAVLPSSSPAQVICDQGLVCLHSNRYSEAIIKFEKAIRLDPNYKEAYHRLGLAHLKMGNLGEAKKAVEAALRIAPSYQPARALFRYYKFPSSHLLHRPHLRGDQDKPPITSRVLRKQSRHLTEKAIGVYLKRWQYTAGALAFILLICLMTFAMQISEKR